MGAAGAVKLQAPPNQSLPTEGLRARYIPSRKGPCVDTYCGANRGSFFDFNYSQPTACNSLLLFTFDEDRYITGSTLAVDDRALANSTLADFCPVNA